MTREIANSVPTERGRTGMDEPVLPAREGVVRQRSRAGLQKRGEAKGVRCQR